MKLHCGFLTSIFVGMLGWTFAVSAATTDFQGVSVDLQLTVNPLITGLYRAGAYEVAVTNASAVKYVDGDLVITYLDTTAAEKSFTLPQPTTARLLAVGGGGAGGQDAKQGYDANYGLPGGGGAGGLVINDAQAFDAKTYAVSVGAGGSAVERELVNITANNKTTKTWVPKSYGSGNNGADTIVKKGSTAIVTAKGGGGGGRRSVGNAGGSGGGGSANYSSSKVQSKNGGTGTSEQGNAGGKGGNAKYGAGGGGAGGPGDPTTNDTVDGSGAGGAGKNCNITGEMLEYARGGAGGIPRVYTHYWDDANGVRHYFTISTDKYGKTIYTYAKTGDKVGSNKYFWCEASDGKPGRDGFGDGGGGSGHYDTNPTFAGRGGNGAVIVRIPPYKTTVEDALKAAFGDRPVMVSDRTVTLTGDVTGPIAIPDNLGAVTINLNGHAIIGANGADGDDITPGGDGQPALRIVPHEYDCESGVTVLSVTGTGSLKGGNGGKGYPGGVGAPAVMSDGCSVASGIAVTAGTDGESLVQHPHQWAYAVENGKIIAYCVADDGVECSYRDHSRGPFVAISAADAAYTAMRYDELNAVNGITPVTGVVIAPETYVGRDGTDYPESSTPPREQGAYTVNMQLGDLRITSDFTITEPKPSQGSVYQAWKTAERKGRDVQIALSATFDGSKAINDGNVLFLGSRCSAHSMAGGTVESSVNAMTRYASVRWYAYGSSDPANNLVDQWTKKGEKVADGTVTLIGANHFVHKEMMDDLYAELVEKKNRADGYDLIILEFDGDLLCREGYAPYQLNYRLPDGWTDEKAERLRAAMSRYYAEDRVVWIVPDVNQEKSDAGYTGEYPWKSNSEFIWQRAFLNATETEGYKCPLQKNYEDADELVDYLQEVLVGHFFSNAIIKDKLAEGLTIKKVTPQMRAGGGIWCNFEGGPSRYTISEPRSGTTVTADVERVERQVTVTFDMKAEQSWACEHNQVIGDDFRVVIDAELDGFFDVGDGEWQETNEGPATFTFTESNLEEDEDGFVITIEKDSPKIQNVKLTPVYTAEDVVCAYDGKGTNIVVKSEAPTPDKAVIRYSLTEHGEYVESLSVAEVCDRQKVWFELADRNGEFTTVTNFACVTILPQSGPPSQVVVHAAYSGVYDGGAHAITVTPMDEGDLIEYLVDGEWVATPPSYTDVTVVTNVFRVTKENYATFVGTNTVTITAKPVTLTSEGNDFVYDGTAHTHHELAGVGGFVAGETFSTNWTGSITNVGTADNTFTIVFDGTAKAVNYVVTPAYGTLEVVPANVGDSSHPGEPAPGTGLDFGEQETVPYKGEVWEPEVVCTNLFERLVEGEDYDVAYCNNLDATNRAAVVITGKGNYTGVFTNYFTIAKIPLTVTADDQELVYGSAVPDASFYTFACSGFTNGEDKAVFEVEPSFGSAYTTTSSVGAPLPITNAIAGVARNYEFIYVDGVLAITKDKGYVRPIDPVTYDGDGQEPVLAVTNAQGIALVKDTDYTVRCFDNTNATEKAYVEVTFVGNYEGVVTNCFTIEPRSVTLASGSEDFVYDGNPHAYTNLTAEGFVAGEGLAMTSNWAMVTDASEGTKDNTFEYTLADGTLAGNYAITVLTGTIAVAAAPVTPKNPAGSAADPDDRPKSADGPVLWAENVVKVYDGVGTNVVPFVYNAVEGNAFAYEYSTNETDWTSDLAFTNVTEGAQKVYFRVVPQGDVQNYLPTNGYAFVTITNRPVTITFAVADKVYDGTAAATCVATNFANLVEGESFTLDVSDASFAFDTPAIGEGKTVTATGLDADGISPVGETKKSNYTFAFADTATASITVAQQEVTSAAYSGVYDGEAHTIAVTPMDAGDTVEYFVNDEWVATPPSYTDVMVATNVFRVTKENYETFEGTNTVTITAKPVTLTSAGNDFVYDGTAHAHHVLAGLDGFVAGETFSTNWLCSITDVGTTNNEFAIVFDGTAKATNYAITPAYGTLEVVPAAPVIPEEDGVRRELPPGTNPPAPDSGSPVSTNDFTGVYDGEAHTILTNQIWGAIAENPLYSGNDPKVEYSADGSVWAEEPLFFTDVVATSFWYRISADNCSNYIHAAAVTITQRVATVTFEIADKVYDGTAAATCVATNFANLVEGERFTLDVSSSSFAFEDADIGEDKTVTATGLDETKVSPVGETKQENYTFEFADTATAAITKSRGYVVPIADAADRIYKGEEYQPPLTVTNAVGEVLEEGTDYTVSYQDNVHATNLAYAVVTFQGNYGGVTTNYFIIYPREVTVTFELDDKVYDGGTEATCAEVHFDNVVEGEGFTLDPSTMTFSTDDALVGENKPVTVGGFEPENVIPVDDGTRKADYTFTLGESPSVTVTAKSIGPVPADPEHPEGPVTPALSFVIPAIPAVTYDGQAQEPEVAVTNGTTGLVKDTDYTVTYGDNTNATEAAYALIEGIGNYSGCFTNYFTILPREVTLQSGTKTMYLDPERPGESVLCSNGVVWVTAGAFVTNAITEVLDGFEVVTASSLTSAIPAGPVPNDFTVAMNPGLATNYNFTLVAGELAILAAPTNAHSRIHEELPVEDGEGILDVIMDNEEAGEYAADRPEQLDEVAQDALANEELFPEGRGPTDDYEVRMIVSTNYQESAFVDTTNQVVRTARSERGLSERDVNRFVYDALDISMELTHYTYDADGQLQSAVTNDIGDKITRLIEIRIPFTFHPKMVDFSIWRHHVSDSGEEIMPLPYHVEGDTETESFATNATGIVFYLKKFSMPLVQQELRLTPQLAGRMRWKYCQAKNSFYGRLEVVCTNGDQTAINNLCYVYEDRDGLYLKDLASSNRLSRTSAVNYGGGTFGKVALPELEQDLRASELGATNWWGVSEETINTNRFIVPSAQRKIALATTSVEMLRDGDASFVNTTLGYLTWQEEGYDPVYWCALGEGLAPLQVDETTAGPPLTLARFNAALGYGLPPTTLDSDPSLQIAAFTMSGSEGCGRIVTVGAGGVTGTPGPNARLEVLGAAGLNGPYELVATPALAADGSFAFALPLGVNFFKVRLTVIPVVE